MYPGGGYHGTWGTMVHLPYHPPVAIYGGAGNLLFPQPGSFRWALQECFPPKVTENTSFLGSRSGFYCVPRALPGDPGPGSRDSWILDQTNRRVFPSLSQNRRSPEKSTFPGKHGSRPHSNQRTTRNRLSRFLALFRHLGACARKPAFPGFLAELIRRVG